MLPAGVWAREEYGVTANGYGVSFWGDNNVLKMSGDSRTELWIY